MISYNNNKQMQEKRQDNNLVMPLPNSGEGVPVYSGDENKEENVPIIILPSPVERKPAFPENSDNSNNSNLSDNIRTIITTYPRPNAPCKFCKNGNTQYGVIRFLNAASGYNPFMVYVNADLFVNSLNTAEVTEYEKISSGMQTVSILAENGYIYIQKQIMVPQNQVMTVAIINTESGLDLLVINDQSCKKVLQAGCIRACNLSVNSGPLNIVIGQRYITFTNVAYTDVTDVKNIWPGDYNYYVSKSRMNTMNAMNAMNINPYLNGNVILASTLSIEMNVSYTIYLFNWDLSSPEAIRALIVEEH